MSASQILNQKIKKKERKKERSNDLEVAHPQNGSSSGLIPTRIGILKCWFFEERGKSEYSEKNLPEQRREATTN